MRISINTKREPCQEAKDLRCVGLWVRGYYIHMHINISMMIDIVTRVVIIAIILLVFTIAQGLNRKASI